MGLALLGCLLMLGCRIGGESSVARENDRLRDSELALSREVVSLRQRLQACEVENVALRREKRGEPPSAELVLPMATSLEIGRLTSFLDHDGDGSLDCLRVFVNPFDQLGRKIPVTAEAVVLIWPANASKEFDAPPDQASASAAPGVAIERPPLAIARFDADAFRDSWRSSFTGRHFALEIGFAPEGLLLPEKVSVEVRLTDLATGVELVARRDIRARSATAP